jgi:ADP-heptose:LPS heptosyltransferase
VSRTLFVRGGALGDFVLTMPALHAALEEGPVDVACRPRFAPLAARCGPVGRIWDIEGADTLWLFGGGGAPVAYDRVIGWSAAYEGCGIPVRVLGAPRPPAGVSAAAHFAGTGDPRLRLGPMGNRDGPIVLAPGASSAVKRWSGWPALAARLGPVVWVGGPLEPELAYRPDLPELIALAERARVWLGADSGPSHLAARFGARTGVIFTATDAATWCPAGARAFHAGVSVEEIEAWVGG